MALLHRIGGRLSRAQGRAASGAERPQSRRQPGDPRAPARQYHPGTRRVDDTQAYEPVRVPPVDDARVGFDTGRALRAHRYGVTALADNAHGPTNVRPLDRTRRFTSVSFSVARSVQAIRP